jgi:hypothetical protein
LINYIKGDDGHFIREEVLLEDLYGRGKGYKINAHLNSI